MRLPRRRLRPSPLKVAAQPILAQWLSMAANAPALGGSGGSAARYGRCSARRPPARAAPALAPLVAEAPAPQSLR
ncbi:hypothetical protein BDA96_03G191600 [Sorghum bicolor]|uniref:Uncharacterized protein n=2 Tax=Sorghum bicolor TaxID=4558 RepID=A0A1B6Q3Y9_SORBI|nr:hypothetical protein BDA96_03G191600 [Sorghum bicolor]KXG32631.1 hypothetical protein SORBI_3003G176500 [Sorghum bicolor]KXG32632.1 hypothetical protein SORBI_3003G176500 [Sorghum bicolor]